VAAGTGLMSRAGDLATRLFEGLRAHGSGLTAQGSRLMAHGPLDSSLRYSTNFVTYNKLVQYEVDSNPSYVRLILISAPF
jgi:hypothetical protein